MLSGTSFLYPLPIYLPDQKEIKMTTSLLNKNLSVNTVVYLHKRTNLTTLSLFRIASLEQLLIEIEKYG